MSCVERACVWPPEVNGYCVFHARMFEETAGRYSTVRRAERGNPKSLHFQSVPHILIHNMVFLRKDKEPFVSSGVSILGAFEYHQETDSVKCHECGEFFLALGTHVNVQHDMGVADYKEKHGISSRTRLMGLFRKNCKSGHVAKARSCMPANYTQGLHRGRTKLGMSPETKNLRGLCAAQLASRLQGLAKDLGHTPSRKEMEKADLDSRTYVKCFGSLLEAAAAAGIAPHAHWLA